MSRHHDIADRRKRVGELIEAGYTHSKIAIELGIPQTTVSADVYHLRHSPPRNVELLGKHKNSGRDTIRLRSQIADFVNSGLPYEEIAKRLELSPKRVINEYHLWRKKREHPVKAYEGYVPHNKPLGRLKLLQTLGATPSNMAYILELDINTVNRGLEELKEEERRYNKEAIANESDAYKLGLYQALIADGYSPAEAASRANSTPEEIFLLASKLVPGD